MKTRLAFALAAAAALLAGAAGAATDVSWQSVEMVAGGASIATNGTLAYAWCQSNGGAAVTNTVNGVPFVGRQDVAGCADFGLSGEWLWDDGGTSVATLDVAYSNLLAHGWWSKIDDETRRKDVDVQLRNLTPGATYLVQLVLASQKVDPGSAPGNTWAYAPGDGSVYARPTGYGGSLVGTFLAEGSTETFTIRYEVANAFLNALQVRKIVSGANPTIGSLTATTFRRTATISLADVGMGTDEDGNPATKYSVSYSLNGGEPATVLRDQTGETAEFALENLADGDYVCEVVIASDKGKTSLPASVTFEIFAQEGNFNALKAAIEGASDGDTIVVNRGIYTATSSIDVTAANLTVVSREGKGKTILDGDSSNRLFRVSASGFTVRGVTFKNGHSTQGGAIRLDGSAAVNTATIRDCDFVDCTARYGGAIYAFDETHADFGPRSGYGLVDGCAFVRCGTSWTDLWNAGGAIYGSLWIEGSDFDACYVEPTASRGQTSVAATGHTTVSNCVFRNQTLRSYGGGLAGTTFGSNNSDCPNGAVRLVGCTIAGNVLDSSNAGLFYDRVWVDRCMVSNTTTTINTSSSGSNLPSLYRSPAAAVARVTSTLFVDNRCPFKLGSVPSLANCTFLRNAGGLVWFQSDSSVPAITNCVFWNNLPKTDGWPWGRKYKGAPGLYWCESPVDNAPLLTAVVQIASTVVEGGSTNAVAEVLALDPSGASARITSACDNGGVRFTAPAKNDWRPREKSPLTNAGALCGWMTGARDLAGRPRAFGGAPDVGCYEHFGEPPTILVLR